jgi:hypothetical protein
MRVFTAKKPQTFILTGKNKNCKKYMRYNYYL